MGVEYELKFQASKEILDAIFRETEGSWKTYAMHTTYFDTDDASLSARKWTLRLRRENENTLCTLKTPLADARGEWEVAATEIGSSIPLLCKLGAPKELLNLTQNGVSAACGAEFTRRAISLSHEGTVLELALDNGILFSGTNQVSFCEVETELKEGSREAVAQFASILSRRYGLQPLAASKFKRALALREKL